MEVEDLFVDLADGVKLLKLLEIISGEKLGKPNNGRMRVHKIENLNKSLAFLHTKVSTKFLFPNTYLRYSDYMKATNFNGIYAIKPLSSFFVFNPNLTSFSSKKVLKFTSRLLKEYCDIFIWHGK